MSSVLAVLSSWPWPLRSGDGRRALAILDALATAGHDVDVCCLTDGDAHTAPGAEPDRQARALPYPRHPVSVFAQARWLVRGGLPLPLLARNPAPARVELAGMLAARAYDVVWCNRIDAWWVAEVVTGDLPLVVDTVDLESTKERSRQASAPPRARSRRLLTEAAGRRTVAAWQHLEWRASRTATVAVCSPEEAEVMPGALVVPNTYPTPTVPLGGTRPGDRPTVLLAGLLTYPPNADGARWLIDSIAPILRRLVPGVAIRLVGRIDPEVADRARFGGVDAVGFVDRLEDELAAADVVVVPIRYGGGTRIKVLEAWAHGLPVVGTTIGVEGLGAVDGTHAIVADDAEAIAAVCARVLGDVALRQHLSEHGRAHHRAHFAEPALGQAVEAAVTSALRSASSAISAASKDARS